MSLPGRCMGCGAPVVWFRGTWRRPITRVNRPNSTIGDTHHCPPTRPRCGAFMPKARERCARRPGHRYGCRSEYALANARRKWVA